jgi:uncharacterized protein (DUF1499 family)
MFAIVMSIVQFSLAISWGPHWLGFAFGLVLCLASIFALSVLIGRFMTSPFHPVVRVIWICCIAILFMLSVFWLTVYTANQNGKPSTEGFPISCGDRDYCVRITASGEDDQRQGFTPPIFSNTSLHELQSVIKNFVAAKSTKVISLSGNYSHSIYVTVFFGFIDDFYTEVVAVNETALGVNIQSFSRAGTRDFGSNEKRVKSFLAYIADVK